MQRDWMLGRVAQYLLIRELGRAQAAGLMVADRGLQQGVRAVRTGRLGRGCSSPLQQIAQYSEGHRRRCALRYS